MRCGVWFLLLACSPSLAGCRSTCPQPVVIPASPVLPVVERKLSPPDVSKLAATAPLVASEPYHRLTADECQSLACCHSTVANLIDVTAQGSPRHSITTAKASVENLRQMTATYLSLEARNRTAGAALELYYRLLEAELLADVLTKSLAEVEAVVLATDKLRANGFKDGPEFLTLRKQQIELRTDHVRLQAGIRKLNTELKSLLALDATPGLLLPVDVIQVSAEPLNATQAVQTGLRTRADLQLLHNLLACLNPSTAAAIQNTLAGLVPPLGAITVVSNTVAPGLHTLFPGLTNSNENGVRTQLQTLLSTREREVAKDITASVEEWNSQRELVALGSQHVKIERGHLEELQIKQRNGLPVETELSKARLDILKAESDQIRDAIKWKQADVKTRQLMGVLCVSQHEFCETSRQSR